MRFYLSIASGSKGNCGLYVNGETVILIDLGVSVRRINQALKSVSLSMDQVNAVLITHEHSDHIGGLSTFVNKYHIPVYASCQTAEELMRRYPQSADNLRSFLGGSCFSVGGLRIESFLTPHDALESVGYLLHSPDYTLGYATDLGFMPSAIQNKLCGCDAVVLESNHDSVLLQEGVYPYPLKKRISGPRGHLSNFDCAACAIKLAENGTKTFILAHLSEQNNDPALALRETKDALHDMGFDCHVVVAPRDVMPAPIRLGWKGTVTQCSLFD